MTTLENALNVLVAAGTITYKAALMRANVPAYIEKLRKRH